MNKQVTDTGVAPDKPDVPTQGSAALEELFKAHLPGMSLGVNRPLIKAIETLLTEARIETLRSIDWIGYDSVDLEKYLDDRIAQLKENL